MPRKVTKKIKHNIHFGGSTKKNDVQTPPLLKMLIAESFNVVFDFDPCPYKSSEDFLAEDAEWGMCNFVNPPYRGCKKGSIKRFINKALQEREKGKTSVFLIPVNSSSDYFIGNIFPNMSSIIFLPKVKFVGYDKFFPRPLCAIKFAPKDTEEKTFRIQLKNYLEPEFKNKKKLDKYQKQIAIF